MKISQEDFNRKIREFKEIEDARDQLWDRAKILIEKGFEIEAYVPHLVSDPLKNPTMTPREVYELDRNQVANSNLIIVYAGVPSFGVGMEVEIASEYKVPVILLMEKSAQVSRMVRGNPTVIAELRFDGFSDALGQLANWLGNQTL